MAVVANQILHGISAVVVVLVGIAALRLPRRDGRVYLLALFAILWGAQATLANLAPLVEDVSTARALYISSSALLLPLGFLVVYFATQFPLRVELRKTPVPWFGTLAVIAAFVLALRPDWIVGGTTEIDGQWTFIPGFLYPWLLAIPLYGGFAYATYAFSSKAADDATPALASRSAFFAAAFGIYLAYVAPGFVLYYAAQAFSAPAPTALGLLLTFLLATAAVARVVENFWRTRWAGRRAALAGIVLAASVGLAENAAILGGVAVVETLGVWRLALVALLVYATARHQLFDVDQKLRRGGYGAWMIAGVVAALFASAAVVTLAPRASSLVLAGTFLIGGLVGSWLMFRPPRRKATSLRESDLVMKRFDLYRASLEESCARSPRAAEDDAWLDDLRKKLGISARDHEILEGIVRASLASKQGKGDATLLRGRYRPLAVLGAGAFGRAVLAEDTTLGRKLVLKQFDGARTDARSRARWSAEARALARVNHPNVVTIYEVVDDAAVPMLAIEWCPNGSLEDRLRAGPLPVAEAFRVARDVAEALAAIHAAGLVHRDVKPANVLFAADGRAKLADFGVATDRDGMATEVGGTPAYMSPEQAAGAAVDARADVYALGATTYQALTACSPRRLAERPWDSDPHAFAGLAEGPRTWLRRCLAADPAGRFASALAARAALPAPEGPIAGAPTEVRPRA